jgi:hypothetical protein
LALACIETEAKGKEDERVASIIFIAAVFIGDENIHIMKETDSV